MASVISLGLHQSAGLQYAIQEQILPVDPDTNSYTWHSTWNVDDKVDNIDDELLVTPRCVIWSRGGLFRKSYNFDLENEPVTQALLTSFPNVDPLLARDGGHKGSVNGASTKSAAIVVFLKTQAHVYFLSGTNHVIHLPFEVENAFAAPHGVVIQRKLRVDSLVSGSLRFPKVPPSSFVSNHPQPWSAATSQHSTFSIADLNAPRPMPMPVMSTLKDTWEPPALKDDSNWPRLFTLSDPLSEIGLVVAEPSKSEHSKRRRSSAKFQPLDTSEEVLYVSRKSEVSAPGNGNALVIAVTYNQVTSTYTVWRLSYPSLDPEKPEKHHVSKGTASRRRSSFVPGSGATTPVPNGQRTFRESFGGKLGGMNSKRGNHGSEVRHEEPLDLAAALNADLDETAIPRRKSRRVSSMLARSDLSASHDRPAFTELASGHPHATSRTGDSIGGRKSSGPYFGNGLNPHLNRSISSFLEAPVDDFLDELRAGGDFEGFHNMGLEDEDFDALKQEIAFTHVCSVAAENYSIRFSGQHHSATKERKLVVLTSPKTTLDDPQAMSIVICILDSEEKRLLIINLQAKFQPQNPHGPTGTNQHGFAISLSSAQNATGVIDICRIDDGNISRLLVINQSLDTVGQQNINLQAPWSYTMPLTLPQDLMVNNVRTLGYPASHRAKREGGQKRLFTQGPLQIQRLQDTMPRGVVAIIDNQNNVHQVQISMQPRSPRVRKFMDVCKAVLPGAKGGEGLLVGWWCVLRWIHHEPIEICGDIEWTAFNVMLLSLVLSLDKAQKQGVMQSPSKQRKARGSFARSSSGAQTQLDSYKEMLKIETANGNNMPAWMGESAWNWIAQQQADDEYLDNGSPEPLIQTHVRLAEQFISSEAGHSVAVTLPPWNQDSSSCRAAIVNVLVALHLLREEEKLDIMTADSLCTGSLDILPLLLQLARWLNWKNWVETYIVEEATLISDDLESSECSDQILIVAEFMQAFTLPSPIPEPSQCPSIFHWIQNCLLIRGLLPFPSLADLIEQSSMDSVDISLHSSWESLTPRTIFFRKFFAAMRSDWTSAQAVEALSAAGMTPLLLQTLPEAVHAPLQESLAQCQAEPPTTWPKELLAMVGREDVTILLMPGQKPRNQSTILAPSHEASSDVHTICNATADAETSHSFDGSAEVDRQAISRSIFKDDRRISEAANILSTFKPTVAHLKAEPEWTDSDLLEAQKDHAQMLAYRTLAIPSGRGLLNFSARIPLITQRFAVGGFNLSCIMKPENNTVGVDKAAFTEEKVCWAFFHAGVAAGLGISRDARGIDTSWILYNKPAQDLSNRHAGFLLALGLNGHLRSVAKWVAFKYLTPKHTMTSIGLLLGLAASYLGTMDSLITRLLSVHVTRMLPPGAAELNLSPLTQTTGIMGIGLLYCHTQHRRMSEIMVSEIEHIDQEMEEEPLRNEGYRLAAGFALGFINLSKGSDLKGLHDMGITERLLTLAIGSKKINLVHVLDKATAAAVVALTLIYLKSENQVVARKIDVPDSVLQFDYIRPDIFLLRTLARHLIMWSRIEPTFSWVKSSLPAPYRYRSKLESIKSLTTEDLPFYNVITGLCFAIALRYAGSGSSTVRDLLLHYLDQLMRICRIPANTFDKRLTRNTIRNCQDLVALAVATAMAGTGDIIVFRRLRAMHGRDDNETPYGSHLAAHLAIGALFLGGGTFTFGTSSLAIAALLVAFYPIFPSTVQDNKSHLQAFRHFWVLAAEPRCLVAKDIDTNQIVPLPITIILRNGQQARRQTPCLIPELTQLSTIRTHSSEYWNIVLDLVHNKAHITSFEVSQTIYVRRRPAHDASTNAFKATLQALNDANIAISQPLQWLFDLPSLATFTKAERALILPPDHGGARGIHAGTEETVIDVRLVLEHATVGSGKRARLLGLRLLFEWAEKEMSKGREMQWIRKEVVQKLQARVWMRESGE